MESPIQCDDFDSPPPAVFATTQGSVAKLKFEFENHKLKGTMMARRIAFPCDFQDLLPFLEKFTGTGSKRNAMTRCIDG